MIDFQKREARIQRVGKIQHIPFRKRVIAYIKSTYNFKLIA